MLKTIIIAEAGVNHNGKVELAYQLIDAAIKAGADIIKFQTFVTESIVTRDAQKAAYQKATTGANESQYQMIKKLELSYDDFKNLKLYCDEKRIIFLSTCDYNSIDFLNDLGLDTFKIPSGEVTNLQYLRKIGQFNHNIILSTGMATLGEVENALQILESSGTDRKKITILHCTTEYPAPFNEVNLRAMETMRDAFKVNVGYSDHTEGIEVSVAAVALGATVIEKHFTLDKNLEGPDHKASLEPAEFNLLVRSIRNIESALGNGIKSPSLSEIPNINIVRKSIHIAKDIKSDTVLTEDLIAMKRPGNGISPMLLDQVIGKKIKEDLKEDHQLKWENII